MERNGSESTVKSEGQTSQTLSVASTAPSIRGKFSNDQVTGAANLTTRQTLRPMTLMTLTSLLTGLSSGITTGQTKAFQNALGISRGTVSWLEIGYFAPFLFVPLTLGLYLAKQLGYRRAIGIACLISGIGHAGYWPSAVYRWFPGFCISSFICGVGVSCALTAKIPYCASCGPKRHSEARTLVMNAIYSMSILLGQVISVFVIYKDKRVEPGKGSVAPIKWAHVGCAAVNLFIAAVYFLVKIPEITDADMEADAASKAQVTGWTARPLKKQILFWAGCIGSFFYDGAQTSIAAFLIQFLEEVLPEMTDRRAASMLMGAVGLSIFSKTLTTCAVNFVRPRFIVGAAFVCMIAAISIAIPIGGRVAAGLFMVEAFARAPVGILIYTVALRGLGRHTKVGAAVLTSMAGASAVMVPFCGYLSERIPLRVAMSVPLGAVVLASSFAVYVNTAKARELDLLRVAEKEEKSHRRSWFGRNDEEKQQR